MAHKTKAAMPGRYLSKMFISIYNILCIHNEIGSMIFMYPPYAQTNVPNIVKPTPMTSAFISSRTLMRAFEIFSSLILLDSSGLSGGPVTPLRELISASRLDSFFKVVNFIVYSNPNTEMIAPELANKFMSLRYCPNKKLAPQNTINRISDVFAPSILKKMVLNFFITNYLNIISVIQFFGSIPRLRNSALPNSFSQLLVLVFSACASSSNCLRSSAGMRIGSIGDLPPPLGCLSRDIDMYMPIGLWLTQIGIYNNMCESIKTTPRSARNTYRASNQTVS
ncbi:hypothetical protein [Salmonella enterica]|uniref:hypothetical protein n=1 Tax=Salmonella enterica TaxID=28901 RepID=UPI00076E7640|nr:hypothetical protein NGUA38_02240 [Salmonella enterica]